MEAALTKTIFNQMNQLLKLAATHSCPEELLVVLKYLVNTGKPSLELLLYQASYLIVSGRRQEAMEVLLGCEFNYRQDSRVKAFMAQALFLAGDESWVAHANAVDFMSEPDPDAVRIIDALREVAATGLPAIHFREYLNHKPSTSNVSV
jgi:Bacterial type III secretion protein (HrpB1_HrpK)